jgi:hypothetical protein
MTRPDQQTLIYCADALERAAAFTDDTISEGRAHLGPSSRTVGKLEQHTKRLRDTAAWLREQVREQELSALRAGGSLYTLAWTRIFPPSTEEIAQGLLSVQPDGALSVTPDDDYYRGTIAAADAIELAHAILRIGADP